jgi:hypothetical protein
MALLGKLYVGLISATMMRGNFPLEAAIDKMYVYGDDLNIKDGQTRENIRIIAKNDIAGGEKKYVGATNYNIVAGVAFSSNEDKIDLRIPGMLDDIEERSLVVLEGVSAVLLGMSMDEFAEFKKTKLGPSLQELWKATDMSRPYDGQLADLAHICHLYMRYPTEWATVEDISASAARRSDNRAKNASAPLKAFVRLIQNNTFGNKRTWESGFRDWHLMSALKDVRGMDSSVDVTLSAVVAVMEHLTSIVDGKRVQINNNIDGAYLSNVSRKAVVLALKDTYGIDIADKCVFTDVPLNNDPTQVPKTIARPWNI